MRILLTFFAVVLSLSVSSEPLVNRLDGACDEIIESFSSFGESTEEGGAIEINFEEYKGVAIVQCEENKFIETMVFFEPSSADEAAYLYNLLEGNLKKIFGDIDINLTQEHAQALYLSNIMIEKPGFVGTTVFSKWGANRNGLDLSLNKFGGNWAVVITYGIQ